MIANTCHSLVGLFAEQNIVVTNIVNRHDTWPKKTRWIPMTTLLLTTKEQNKKNSQKRKADKKLTARKWELNSVKRSDVTGNRFEWNLVKTTLYNYPPLPYFLVLAGSAKTKEVKAIVEITRR